MRKFDIVEIVAIIAIVVFAVMFYRDQKLSAQCEKLGGIRVQDMCIQYKQIYPERD